MNNARKIEENDRLGKIRMGKIRKILFSEMGNIKGIFHARMGKISD